MLAASSCTLLSLCCQTHDNTQAKRVQEGKCKNPRNLAPESLSEGGDKGITQTHPSESITEAVRRAGEEEAAAPSHSASRLAVPAVLRSSPPRYPLRPPALCSAVFDVLTSTVRGGTLLRLVGCSRGVVPVGLLCRRFGPALSALLLAAARDAAAGRSGSLPLASRPLLQNRSPCSRSAL